MQNQLRIIKTKSGNNVKINEAGVWTHEWGVWIERLGPQAQAPRSQTGSRSTHPNTSLSQNINSATKTIFASTSSISRFFPSHFQSPNAGIKNIESGLIIITMKSGYISKSECSWILKMRCGWLYMLNLRSVKMVSR